MKGKLLAMITAILFGATMVATPIVMAAGTDTGAGMEEQAKPKPAKTKAKKSTKKKSSKKKSSKKKKAEPSEEKSM
jgi:BRCT domain type II-containing protein